MAKECAGGHTKEGKSCQRIGSPRRTIRLSKYRPLQLRCRLKLAFFAGGMSSGRMGLGVYAGSLAAWSASVGPLTPSWAEAVRSALNTCLDLYGSWGVLDRPVPGWTLLVPFGIGLAVGALLVALTCFCQCSVARRRPPLVARRDGDGQAWREHGAGAGQPGLPPVRRGGGALA
jgi:hypothetical protein